MLGRQFHHESSTSHAYYEPPRCHDVIQSVLDHGYEKHECYHDQSKTHHSCNESHSRDVHSHVRT